MSLQIRTDESRSEHMIRVLWETGRLWSVPQDELKTLSLRDKVVVDALIDFSKFHEEELSWRTLHHHQRLPIIDGSVGPATAELFELDVPHRCPIPDYAPPPGVSFSYADPYLQDVVLRMQENATAPALGSGNWPQCHGQSGVHCVACQVDMTNCPSHVRSFFTELLTEVQIAWAEIGLLVIFVGADGNDMLTGERWSSNINIKTEFVARSDGWIGLAHLLNNQTCSMTGRNWFLATYTGGNTVAEQKRQWIGLWLHEWAHNCGLNHEQSGIMAPVMRPGTATRWNPGDPATPKLTSRFSGVKVPIPGKPDDPSPGPDDPKPPSSIQSQLDEITKIQRRQQIMLEYLIKKDSERV